MSRSCRAHLEEQLIALEIELNIFYLQTKRVVTRYKKIVNDRKGVTKGFLSLDPKTMQFTLIVHIPLVSNSNLLELYEFLPLPIHFNWTMSRRGLPSAKA